MINIRNSRRPDVRSQHVANGIAAVKIRGGLVRRAVTVANVEPVEELTWTEHVRLKRRCITRHVVLDPAPALKAWKSR
jgi:hypothetical protein